MDHPAHPEPNAHPPGEAPPWADFPPPLRALIEAELAAGNTLLRMGHTHPAAPCGAWAMLAQPVQAERRRDTADWTFYERYGSHHAGEFTTADRCWFVLEAPGPPPEPADMDAIREALAERERAADARRYQDR